MRAVLKVFVDLYGKGLIYRDNYMVNWDPGSRSAISDLEVEDREVTDTLYYVDYPLSSGNGSLTVATVRPETMLADTAIAVHPADERYTRLVGETAVLPLVGRRLRDHRRRLREAGVRHGRAEDHARPRSERLRDRPPHGLEEIVVIGEDGRMNAAAGERFAGMTALEAREAVVAALREEGRIVRTEPYTHSVPYSHRSGERIEPLISLQWFMRMDELARPAIEVVADGRIRIHPENQRRRYLEWLANIRPWCISRQLWWGHRIPVWYRGEDEVYVGVEPPDGEGWVQDPDVLDTWFSSGLWPFATLGWPDDTPELRAFYPTDVLSTARDILFLWVARMVMLGLEFTGDVPFDDVYVHSTILATDGRRMSKSLGTGIDPIDLIDRHGADGTRFGLLAMSSTQDVRFSEEKIVQGQQLANKLFNASRLVLLRVPDGVTLPASAPEPETVEDAWILSRLQAAIASTTAAIDAFEFHRVALGLYDFVYGELCDWYLEIVKPRLYAEDNARVAEFALHVLGETLALAHPVIPFVTEELWSHVPGAEGLLMARRWPLPDETRRDPRAEEEVGRAIAAVQELRGWRDRVGAAPGSVLPARLEATGYERTSPHVARLARVEWSADGGDPTATVAVPGGSVAVLSSDAVDLEAAGRRVEERRQWLAAEIERAERKLGNAGLRGQGAASRRAGRARQARPLPRGARRVVSWSLEQAEEHLLGLELFGMRFGLERMRRLLTALGSPQERFSAVHVVGTNGKSSTVRMTAALLEAHGVKSGAFLSPHLTTFAERIRIGDADLEPAAFGAAVQRAAAAAAKVDRTLEGGERVTQFELITAAAFDELARRGVEVAAVEAGLGGRHDATGVLRAPVVVLTNVGLEHTRWLGPTIADIAREKLAVVQPGATLVLGEVDGRGARARAGDRGGDRAPATRQRRPARLPAHQLLRGVRGGACGARPARRRHGGRRGAACAGAGPDAGGRGAAADDPRRRAQRERRGGARRRAPRPPLHRGGVHPRRQGRGCDAGHLAPPLRALRLHGGAHAAGAPARHAGLAGGAAGRRGGGRAEPVRGARARPRARRARRRRDRHGVDLPGRRPRLRRAEEGLGAVSVEKRTMQIHGRLTRPSRLVRRASAL